MDEPHGAARAACAARLGRTVLVAVALLAAQPLDARAAVGRSALADGRPAEPLRRARFDVRRPAARDGRSLPQHAATRADATRTQSTRPGRFPEQPVEE